MCWFICIFLRLLVAYLWSLTCFLMYQSHVPCIVLNGCWLAWCCQTNYELADGPGNTRLDAHCLWDILLTVLLPVLAGTTWKKGFLIPTTTGMITVKLQSKPFFTLIPSGTSDFSLLSEVLVLVSCNVRIRWEIK